jgi:hypothetical protein
MIQATVDAAKRLKGILDKEDVEMIYHSKEEFPPQYVEDMRLLLGWAIEKVLKQPNLDQPLQVTVIDGCFTIRVGIDRLKHATEHAEIFYDYEKHGARGAPYVKVTDRDELVKDIKREMQREREDGSTPLSDFLDEVTMAAYEDGSTAFERS